MDGNKDEALKCLKIGREALDLGDRFRALKFISKARRLDPNLEVDDLLSSLDGESAQPTASDSSAQTNGNGNGRDEPIGIPSLRKRVPSSGSSSSSSTTATAKDYTQDQISIVRQIKKQKDYYEILGVEKDCSVEDVRKAYRKLSLKVHPDKNKAPGAEEAFKSVSKAFQCLSNEETRKSYDVTGSEEVYERAATRRGHHQGFNGFYEAEFDPDEIFRNFFYGGVPGATTQFGSFSFGTRTGPSMRTANHGSNGSGNSNLRALIQLLPILLVVLLNFLPSNEPVYSLSRSYQYEHVFSTERGVNFFVKSRSFEQDYPPDSHERVKLELQIEKEYYSIVSHNCRLEMQRQHWGLTQETPYCDMLKQFEAAG